MRRGKSSLASLINELREGIAMVDAFTTSTSSTVTDHRGRLLLALPHSDARRVKVRRSRATALLSRGATSTTPSHR